jgi:membrane-bound serine protease (ClpP class)
METEALLASSDWVNAGGIMLVLIGISFLILEFFVPSFGLFGFAGVASILIGVVQLHQTGYIEEIPVSINTLIVLAIIGVFLSVAGGIYSYKLYKKKVTTGIEAMLGETASVIDWQGKTGHISIEGENWKAYTDDTLDLQKGDPVLISKIDGLKIKVIKAS